MILSLKKYNLGFEIKQSYTKTRICIVREFHVQYTFLNSIFVDTKNINFDWSHFASMTVGPKQYSIKIMYVENAPNRVVISYHYLILLTL